MEKRSFDLKSFDDIFSTEEQRQDDQREKVTSLPLTSLHPFENHPFHVLDDEQMDKTVESVQQYGVLVPILVRPKNDGNYEIVSGHRRSRAAELAGLTEIPAIVRNVTDDEAIIVMVDSNLQREEILPSEKAFAYKMKLEAMKRQAGRPSKNGGQVDHNYLGQKTRDIIGDQAGESGKQVQRYIRLTNLIPELLDNVDQRKIGFSPAVELSYLPEKEQIMLLSAIEYAGIMPSMQQARKIKKYSQAGKVTPEVLEVIMNEEQIEETDTFKIKPSPTVIKAIHHAFGELSNAEMNEKIIGILEKWARAQERRMER